MTPDLEKLRALATKLRGLLSELEFSLVDDPAFDPWDLKKPKKGRRMTPDLAANTAAMIATNELISWFGRRGGGFVGLWRGPKNHALADAPIVQLDSEGQYRIVATTVPDYLVGASREGMFTEVRRELVAAGFKVSRTRDAIAKSCDACPDKPNDFRNALFYANRKAAKKSPAKQSTRKTQPASEWWELSTDGGILLFAPAETAVKWSGYAGGSRIRITFRYWQRIQYRLPDDIRPKHGHRDTPHITVDSQADADALVEKLRRYVLARHPKMTVKTQSNLQLTTFVCNKNNEYQLIVAPETEAELAAEAMLDVDVLEYPVGRERALLWTVSHGDARVRATPDEILIIDCAEPDLSKLAALVGGKPRIHGTWTCKKLLVAIGVWISVAELKNVGAASVADLARHIGTPLYKRREPSGGGLVIPASGTFRAESGGSKAARWLRFVRT